MTTIVVGYVATPEGEAALQRGIDEARLRDATVVVVLSHKGGVATEDEHMADETEDIQRLGDQLTQAGVPHEIRGLVRGNEPATDIVGIAVEYDAELIVIGLRRRSPVGKLLLGSNAQRVLLDADCPVLAVKAGD
ncbi:MAG: universal stress protein [Actinomycetes bacterium]